MAGEWEERKSWVVLYRKYHGVFSLHPNGEATFPQDTAFQGAKHNAPPPLPPNKYGQSAEQKNL